ncbi:MAG: pitrilysin family protein [Anaerolineaceae bacterium]|nr:pitrilysin family protein [Anaerolineaceae bacterium]
MNGSIPDSNTILRERFANGSTLLAYPNPTSPAVYFTGYMQPGAIAVPEDQIGLPSFTTDMLITGTKRLNFQQLHDKIESVGASLSMGTGHLSTTFFGQCLREDLETIWSLLVEVIQEPAFAEKQFKRVRNQILTGIAIQNQDTAEMASQAFNQALYGTHPYAYPDIGCAQTVANLQKDQLETFHQTHYGPKGLVLAVSGGIEPEMAQEIFSRTIASWQVENQGSPTLLPPFNPPTSSIRTHVPLEGKNQSDLIIGVPAPKTISRDYQVCSIGNAIFGKYGMMGRIGRVVREKAGLAYEVSSHLGAGIGPTAWTISAGVNPDNLEKAITLLKKELERFRGEPVTQQELLDVKTQSLGRLPLSLETNSGIASVLVSLERYGYSLDHLRELPGIIESVTAEEILAAAQRYWDMDKLVITSAGKPLS